MTAVGNIHPTAVVHPSARIDPAAEIGPYAVIGEDTVIGARTKVGPHAVIEFATIGQDNKIFPGCFIGTAPQDLKYAGQKTRFVMGDRNTVREAAHLNRGTTATGETRIGSECLIMAFTHIAHDCRVGNRVILVNNSGLAGHVEVADNVIISTQVGVHQFVRVGRGVMISAGSMVGKDVPPFCYAQGDRARLRGLNLVGLRRSGLPRQNLSALKEAYKTLFLSGLLQEEALRRLKSSPQPPEAQEFIAFVEGSKRGVMRPTAEPEEVEA